MTDLRTSSHPGDQPEEDHGEPGHHQQEKRGQLEGDPEPELVTDELGRSDQLTQHPQQKGHHHDQPGPNGIYKGEHLAVNIGNIRNIETIENSSLGTGQEWLNFCWG